MFKCVRIETVDRPIIIRHKCLSCDVLFVNDIFFKIDKLFEVEDNQNATINLQNQNDHILKYQRDDRYGYAIWGTQKLIALAHLAQCMVFHCCC